jgi:hypothetical protein
MSTYSFEGRRVRSSSKFTVRALAAAVLTVVSSARAQSARVGDEPILLAALGEPYQLAALEVQGSKEDGNILPTRPLNLSVYGFDTSVKNTPRSIHQIAPDQLRYDIIDNGQDLSRYAPSMAQNYTNRAQSAPTLRGGSVDQYQNGIRVSRGGSSVSFTNNTVELVDIVAGPAPSVFGPSASTSGYINFISKKPYLDKHRTELRTEIGDFYVRGQSHENFRQTIDVGGPLIDGTLGYRVSFQAKGGESFYGGADEATKRPENYYLTYAALTWLPRENVQIDVNFQYNKIRNTTSRGVNRVTQDLIDNRRYIAGIATPILRRNGVLIAPVVNPAGRTEANPTGLLPQYRLVTLNGASGSTRYVTITNTPAPANAIPTLGAAPGAQATAAVVGWVYEPQNVSLRQIEQNRSYVDRDFLDIDQLQVQSLATVRIGDALSLRNNFYVEWLEGKGTQLYQTGADVQEDFLVTDRVEALTSRRFALGGVDVAHQSNTGIDARYSRNTTYGLQLPPASTPDLFDVRSLSTRGTYGVSLWDAAATQTAPTSYLNSAFGDITVPGHPVAYPIPDYPDLRSNPASSGFAETTTLGLYSQHEFDFADRLAWIVGARASFVYVEALNPIVPATGTRPAFDDGGAVMPSGNTSLVFKASRAFSLYATYAYTEALNANDAPVLTNGVLDKAQFESEAELYEAGVKFELIPGKLFGNAAVYHQDRQLAPVTQINADQSTSIIIPVTESEGVELALQYQPNKKLAIYGNVSVIDSVLVDFTNAGNKSDGPNHEVGTLNANGEVVALVSQSRNNAPFSSTPRANYRQPGVPDFSVNLGATYRFNSGFGTRVSGWIWGPQSYYIDSDIEVPTQHNLDIAFFYAPPRQKWEVQLTFTNVTDQYNFRPNGSTGASDFINVLPPLGAKLLLTYNF